MNRHFLTLAIAVLVLMTAFISCSKDKGGGGSGGSGGEEPDSPFAGIWLKDGILGGISIEMDGTTWVVKFGKETYCNGEYGYGYKGNTAVLEITDAGKSNAEVGDVGAAKMTDDIMTVSGFSDGVLNGTFVKKTGSDVLKGIKFEEDEITLIEGATRVLELVAIPFGADLPPCNFTSDDPNIATVNKITGEVTAKAKGLAVITATTDDGNFTANCFVTVIAGGLVIDATVVNGNNYNGIIDDVKMWNYTDYVYASCKYANGGFKLNLPETVAEYSLRGIYDALQLYYFDGTISDPEAKMTNTQIRAFDKNANYIGEFWCGDSYYSDNLMAYVYVDRDVIIQGNAYYYDYYQYDCAFTKGWNIMYGGWNGGYYRYTTQKPSGADYKWYYYDGWKKSPGDKDKLQP